MDSEAANSQLLRSMELLATRASVKEHRPGEVIFAAGDPGDCFYGVLSGAVTLSWADGSGTEVLGAGHVFGEGALVQPDHRRHATATAREHCKLLVLDRETFLFALEALPMFGLEVMASMEARLQAARKTGPQP